MSLKAQRDGQLIKARGEDSGEERRRGLRGGEMERTQTTRGGERRRGLRRLEEESGGEDSEG